VDNPFKIAAVQETGAESSDNRRAFLPYTRQPRRRVPGAACRTAIPAGASE